VPFKEAAGALEMRFVEVNEAPIAPQQRDAACAPDPVATVVANDRRGDRGCHDRIDREMSARGESGRRDQGCLARERDPEALEAHQEKENDVAVGGNEPRYSPLHRANLQCAGTGA